MDVVFKVTMQRAQIIGLCMNRHSKEEKHLRLLIDEEISGPKMLEKRHHSGGVAVIVRPIIKNKSKHGGKISLSNIFLYRKLLVAMIYI